VAGTEITCELESDAVLTGLLTLFHMERSSDVVINKQNQVWYCWVKTECEF
jgi:hypothetical protein